MVVAGACASGNARHSRKGPRLVAVRRQRLWARRRITLTRDRAPPAAPTRAATVDGPGIVSVALVFGPLHPGPYSVARARPSTRSRDRQQIIFALSGCNDFSFWERLALGRRGVAPRPARLLGGHHHGSASRAVCLPLALFGRRVGFWTPGRAAARRSPPALQSEAAPQRRGRTPRRYARHGCITRWGLASRCVAASAGGRVQHHRAGASDGKVPGLCGVARRLPATDYQVRGWVLILVRGWAFGRRIIHADTLGNRSMVYARRAPAECDSEDRPVYLHCMLPGHLYVDEAKLEALAGGPCRLIESDELFRVTGAVVGGVHPFVPGVSKRLLDRRVLENAAGGGQVSFNTGDLRVGLLVAGDAFQQALDSQASVVDLAMSEPGEEIEELAQAQILKSARHSALA